MSYTKCMNSKQSTNIVIDRPRRSLLVYILQVKPCWSDGRQLIASVCGSEKDGDAYQESSRSEIKRNEKFIRRLRQENRNKHIQVADLENVRKHL